MKMEFCFLQNSIPACQKRPFVGAINDRPRILRCKIRRRKAKIPLFPFGKSEILRISAGEQGSPLRFPWKNQVLRQPARACCTMQCNTPKQFQSSRRDTITAASAAISHSRRLYFIRRQAYFTGVLQFAAPLLMPAAAWRCEPHRTTGSGIVRRLVWGSLPRGPAGNSAARLHPGAGSRRWSPSSAGPSPHCRDWS